jgi:hypothetical protein
MPGMTDEIRGTNPLGAADRFSDMEVSVIPSQAADERNTQAGEDIPSKNTEMQSIASSRSSPGFSAPYLYALQTGIYSTPAGVRTAAQGTKAAERGEDHPRPGPIQKCTRPIIMKLMYAKCMCMYNKIEIFWGCFYVI